MVQGEKNAYLGKNVKKIRAGRTCAVEQKLYIMIVYKLFNEILIVNKMLKNIHYTSVKITRKICGSYIYIQLGLYAKKQKQ